MLFRSTLDLKQSVTLCLVDLAKGYERKMGEKAAQDDFMIRCAKLALAHNPQNINAKLLWAETLGKRLLALMKQREARAVGEIMFLPQAKALVAEMERLYGEMVAAGYREMPKAMYQNWLTSVGKIGRAHV